jgi:hypothetical protein
MKRRRRIALGIFIVALAFCYRIESFLSQQSPIPARMLVAEAWFADEDQAVREIAAIVHRDGYRRVVAVGAQQPGGGTMASDSVRLAHRLRAAGLNDVDLVTIDFLASTRHRTYTSARAVRQWMDKNDPACDAVNVFTLGVHGRKSRILFQKALEPGVKVGVIAGTPTEYRPGWWFCSLRGIYLVARNTVGYLYALGFQPVRDTSTN